MRSTGWWLVAGLVGAIAVACGGGTGVDDAGGGRSNDGGVRLDAGFPSFDAGTIIPPDAGTGADAGTDAGTDGGADAGTDAGPITFPSMAGWEFFGPQHGGPAEVYGVTADKSGNVWVAGGADGLFLLTPGATEYKRFTIADGLSGYTDASGPRTYDVISVEGGPADTVFVGYRGVTAGLDEGDPAWMLKSGDADKVVWNGATLTVTHFDISSPPGFYESYPQGREKIRNVHRMIWDEKTGNVWFGGDHGVGLYEAHNKTMWEHQHATINGYTKTAAADPGGASYTMLSGDWKGIGLDGNGDLWMGGGHRVARLHYGTEGGNFWATIDPKIDVWPDAVLEDARPEQRTDDLVEDLIASADGSFWVGSLQGLAHVAADGTISYVAASRMVDPKVTALERDPSDGSIWVGHLWGGVTRLGSGSTQHFGMSLFGKRIVDGIVRDIQSDTYLGQRRILVAFSSGAVAIYTGP